MTMKKIKLFDYQEDMVKRVQEAFKHHDAVMVQMPTGTGKTMVLANIVFSFLEKSNNPIWIVAHRRELVSQIKETVFSKITPSLFTLKEVFSKTHPSSLTLKGGSTSHPSPLSSEERDVTAPPRRSEPLRSKDGGPSKVSPDCAGWDRLNEEINARLAEGLAGRESKVSPDCLSAGALKEALSSSGLSSLISTSIKVTSIQWLSKHYREMEEKPGLIVIDEAHHALAETYAEVMNAYPKAKKLGLTTTPYRLNGKGFTDLHHL